MAKTNCNAKIQSKGCLKRDWRQDWRVCESIPKGSLCKGYIRIHWIAQGVKQEVGREEQEGALCSALAFKLAEHQAGIVYRGFWSQP